MIHVQDLSVRYGAVAALQGISLHVRQGECLLISGPSGCGKSTLARALVGLIPHALQAEMEGRVQIGGLDTRNHPLPVLAQHAGIVFQNPGSQLFHLRVYDEVAFGPRNLGLDQADVERRVKWALEAAGLSHLRERRPAELSGGEKQCLAIASVLSMLPRVLVLDEPSASLDVPSRLRLMKTLRALRAERDLTLVIVEHRLAEAAHLADRLVLMESGQLVIEGAPLELLADASLRSRMGLRRPAGEALAPWPSLVEPDAAPRDPAVTPGSTFDGLGRHSPLLALNAVSAGYHGRAVLHDIDLAVSPGDFVAVVGDIGSGKSTLAMVAAGLLRPMRGSVLHAAGRRPRPGLDVALLFQDPTEQLFTDTVDEEVAFGPRNYGCFDARTHLETLRQAGLSGLRERRPHSLSAGQQQRTALAACLALRPSLVILDEPTLGQDWGHLARLMDWLHELNRMGSAVVLITHDYKLVHRYARRAVLLDRGRVVSSGPLAAQPRYGANTIEPEAAEANR